MLDKIYFQLTEEHVKLMRRFNIRWDDGYDGAPAVDCKRPFGNGDWENDVAEIKEAPVAEKQESVVKEEPKK